MGSLVTDLIVSAPRFPESGETVIGTDFRTAPGGKGANQAVQAARLGAAVDMVGKVGNDSFGDALLQTVAEAGVDVSRIGRTPDAPTAVGNVQLQTAGGKTANRILIVPGANYCLTPADVAFLETDVRAYDIVMLQLEIPMEVNAAVVQAAHHNGVPVMLNPAPYAPLDPALVSKLTYLSPNEHEAADLTGIPVQNEADARTAAEALLARGVRGALLTLGSRGAAFADREGFRQSPCLDDIPVQDPTAAGDSFVAAFCTGVCSGMPIHRAMTFANFTASLTVSRMGAQPSLPTRAEVETLLRQRGIEPAQLFEA